MIKAPIGVHLRGLDFRKKRNAFFRSTEHGWIAIDFQASQFGTRERVSFTVNLAVHFVELREDADDRLTLGLAHIDHQRIGHLLPQARDFWWHLEPETDVKSVSDELVSDLDRYAIPWLERRQVFSEALIELRVDPAFIQPFQISRLSVLARRVGKDDLSDELRRLSDHRHQLAERSV
jgi:hypothetical protein